MSDLTIPIPNFQHQAPTQKMPVEMLREAAQTLTQQTGEVVEGTVFTSNPGSSNLFRHTFYLRARSLNDYTYPLFYVWHNADPYNETYLLEAGQPQTAQQRCTSPEDLRDKLIEIFKAPATAQLIESLMAQAGE